MVDENRVILFFSPLIPLDSVQWNDSGGTHISPNHYRESSMFYVWAEEMFISTLARSVTNKNGSNRFNLLSSVPSTFIH